MSLLSAALAGEIDKVKELITRGADVNQADEDGVTPVHNAVKNVSVNYDSATVSLMIPCKNPKSCPKLGSKVNFGLEGIKGFSVGLQYINL